MEEKNLLGARYLEDIHSDYYYNFDWVSFHKLSLYPNAKKLGKPLRFHSIVTQDTIINPTLIIERILNTIGEDIFAANLLHELYNGRRFVGIVEDFPKYFQLAKSLAPQAKFYIGDFRQTWRGTEKWKELIDMAEWLKPYGCEGLSVQLHRRIETPIPTKGLGNLIYQCRRKGIGLSFDETRVLITQKNKWPNSTRLEKQKKYYSEIWKVALDNNIPMGLWHIDDAVLCQDRVSKIPDFPGLWDKHGNPKPCYSVFFKD